MSKTNRRLIAPAVVGSAAATLAQFMPGAAFAASPQASQHASTTASGPDAAASSSANATPDVTATGCDSQSSPDYGCGKITAEAQPVTGTFPADALPNLSGLLFDITGPITENNVKYDGGTSTCSTGDTVDGSAACAESVWGDGGGGPNEGGPWEAGGQYTVALDTAESSPPAPANTLIPPLTGVFLDCSAYQDTMTTPSGCPDVTPVPVYGTYHQVGLHITNSVTHKAVAKATYQLCAATTDAPTPTAKGCPSDGTALATATTNSHGKLVFAGLYLGSQNYSVALSHVPHGYKTTRSQRLEVPVVTKVTQAGTLYQGTGTLAPIKTTVKTQHVTTSKDKRVSFNALAGAKHVVGPLRLIKVGKASHGKVRHSHGRITYTPRKGFVGKDVFTYTVRNGVGVKGTGKAIIHVRG